MYKKRNSATIICGMRDERKLTGVVRMIWSENVMAAGWDGKQEVLKEDRGETKEILE